MSKLYINNKGIDVPVAELELISTKEQLVLGNLERDLILRTAGNVKIQVGNKFYDLPMSESTDSVGTGVTLPSESGVIVLNSDSELLTLAYPGDGSLIYIKESKTFYVADGSEYTLINRADNNKIFLSFDESQNLTGDEKYTLAFNTGNTISSLSAVASLPRASVFPGMVIFAIAEGKHYQLTDEFNSTITESWKELYLSLDGGTVEGPVTIKNSRLLIDSQFKDTWLPLNSNTFDGIFLGSSNYANGLGIWKTADNVIFSTQDQTTFGYKFMTRGSDQNAYNPLSISNNSVGIGGGISYSHSLAVSGPALLRNKVTMNQGFNSPDFIEGINGTGYDLSKDSQDKWTLEVDKLVVRNDFDSNLPQYKTKAIDGSLIMNYSVVITDVDLIESIPVVVQASKVGKYSDIAGTVMPLKDRVRYATITRTPIASLTSSNVVTPVTELFKLPYGIGDKTAGGALAPYTTYTRDGSGSLVIGTGTVEIDVINVFEIQVNSDVSTFAVGDLFFYKEWSADKVEYSVTYAEVVAITEDSLIVYVYGRGYLNSSNILIKIGNKITQESFIQLNASDRNSPYLEVADNITDFNDFIENFYYSSNSTEDTDDRSNNRFTKDNVRVKIGLLADIVDTDLGLTAGAQSGLYSDNAYLKGKFVGTKVKFGSQLDFQNDILTIVDLETVKNRTITGSGGLSGGGKLFTADVVITHKDSTWVTKSDLTAGNVISNLSFDQYGHPTGWTTRNLDNVYQLRSEKNAANGYAGLGADGKLFANQLPTLVITDTFVVASQAAMLGLSTAEQGDIAIRTDINKTYVLASGSPATLTNWKELLTPTDLVTSVNGLTGIVTLTTTNIAEGTNLYFTTARAIGSALTGYSVGPNSPVIAGDSILAAFGKLQAQISAVSVAAETDPTVGSHIKAITTTNISNWNTAYSWGNHAGLYKPVSYVPSWDEITNKPSTIGTETDPTVGSHIKAITTTQIANWNGAAFLYPRYPDSSEYDLNNDRAFGVRGVGANNTNAPLAYASVLSLPNADTGLQITGGHGTDQLLFRGWWNWGATWNPWRTLWHNGNLVPDVATTPNTIVKRDPDGWLSFGGAQGLKFASGGDIGAIFYEGPANGSGKLVLEVGDDNAATQAVVIRSRYWNTTSTPFDIAYFSANGSTTLSGPTTITSWLNVGGGTVNGGGTKIYLTNAAATKKMGFSAGRNSVTEENLYIMNVTDNTYPFIFTPAGDLYANSFNGNSTSMQTVNKIGVHLINGNNAPTISLAIGDYDTGFNQIADGILSYVSNGITQFEFSPTSIRTFLGLGSNATNSTAFLPLTGGSVTGSLAVGTSNAPVEALDVTGNIKASGTIKANTAWFRGVAGGVVISDNSAAGKIVLRASGDTGSGGDVSITGGNNLSTGGTITASGGFIGNATTSQRFLTARLINGVSFNGSADITIADSTKLPLAGGTLTGNLNGTNATFTGTVTASGGGFTSLRELKDIKEDWAGNALDEINKLQVRQFEYLNNPGQLNLGLIIDEVPDSSASVILTRDRRSVNSYTLHGLSLLAHKETKSRIEILEEEVKQLKNKLIANGLE